MSFALATSSSWLDTVISAFCEGCREAYDTRRMGRSATARCLIRPLGAPLVLDDAGARVEPTSRCSHRNCGSGTVSPLGEPCRRVTVGERRPAREPRHRAARARADETLDTEQRLSCRILNSRSVTDRPLCAILRVITAIPGGSCVTTRAEHQNNRTTSTERIQIARRSSTAVATVATPSPDHTGDATLGSTWS